MSHRFMLLLACAAALVLAGCGGEETRTVEQPQVGLRGTEKEAAQDLGFPGFATKNTTRVGGADAVAVAAATARAVFPGATPEGRPRAVALADGRDWRIGLVASALMAQPIGAPLLLSDGPELPAASASALEALAPRGAEPAGDAQVIRVGDVARPDGLETTDVTARRPAGVARAMDSFLAAAQGRPSDAVMVVSAERPEFAMPAAAWAAKSGDPILFATRDRLPPETAAAVRTHQQPKIYVLGPTSVIGSRVTRELRRLGTVVRVGGQDPVRNAIAFARFQDGDFGWGVVDPGHGLLFVSQDRPLDAPAAAPLASAGTYAPLLLTAPGDRLPRPLEDYLLDIQPGYEEDPVRGVYNHGWIIGDDDAVSVAAQARIDALLEIAPVRAPGGEDATATTP